MLKQILGKRDRRHATRLKQIFDAEAAAIDEDDLEKTKLTWRQTKMKTEGWRDQALKKLLMREREEVEM